MAEFLNRIKAFINSTVGMIVTIGVLVVLVAAIWGYIFLSSSPETAKVPQVTTSGAIQQNNNDNSQPAQVDQKPQGNKGKNETTTMDDLELFQLKDPFRPLVSEAEPSKGSKSESGPSNEQSITTGSPVVPLVP